LAAVSGCAQVLGLGDFEDAEGTAGSGGSGGAGTTSTSSQGGGATTSTTSSAQGGGGAGQGGDGGQGGAPVCAQGESIPCYTGDPALPGKGACAEGTATCLPDGTGYGDCEGEVLPAAEDCATPTDENCDEQVNEGCACAPGTMAVCYSGAAGTENSAPCKAGFMTCNLDGLGFGPCLGEVTPQAEVCEAQLIDEDCDGTPNDGCTCIPGTNAPCYTGPLGTGNVGLCMTGTHSCLPDGSGYGACLGEITPQPEVCEAGQKDENCDGTANEGCICGPNSTAVCYTGPAGTQGVGICAAGTKTCAGDGLSYGACMGETVPAAETCGAVADEDCSGADCVVWGKGLPTSAQAMDADGAGNTYVLVSAAGTHNFGGGNLIGAGSNDVFVAKYDATGAYVWAVRWGDAQDQTGMSLDVNTAGDIVVSGRYKGTLDFGGGLTITATATADDVFVAKLTTAGAVVWAKSFGTANNTDQANAVSLTPQNDVVVAGNFNGTINFGGGVLTSAGSTDLFIAKLKAADGTQLWANRYGDASTQGAARTTVDSGGNIWVAGNFGGSLVFGGVTLTATTTYDLYLARFDGAGTSSCRSSWASSAAAGIANLANSLGTDSTGAAIMSGSFYGSINFGGGALTTGGVVQAANAFLVKFNSVCGHSWSKSLGTPATSDYASASATMNGSDDIVFAMSCNAGVDLGGGVLPYVGSYDIMVAKYNSTGTHLWSRAYGNANSQDFPQLAALPSKGWSLYFSNNGAVDLGLGPISAGAVLGGFAQ
jgi:hypothetical protein